MTAGDRWLHARDIDQLRIFSIAMVLLAGCGDSPRDPCDPGTFRRCVCDGGAEGTSECVEGDFGPCACEAATDAGLDAAMDTEDAGACPPISCRAIDLLFVVDNSISMVPMQANLERNFERFAARLDALLPTSDIHVMVVDSDSVGYEGFLCEEPCPASPCEGYRCGSVSERDECDTVLGAGVVHPIGDEAANERCLFPDGQRWVSRSDTYFTEAVRCAARVGASGDGEERPLGAMLAALDQTGEGECNEGFLRPQALLAVVLITDASPGTAMELTGSMEPFYEGLLDLKCGNEEAVAFLGFVHGADADVPRDVGVDVTAFCAAEPESPCCELCLRSGPSATDCQLCFENEEGVAPSCWTYFSGPAAPLENLIERFGERGFQASVCAADYGAPFEEAVDLIDRACTLI